MRNTCKEVYVVDGCRTPFLKTHGRPGPFSASALAFTAGRALLARQPFEPAALDEVIVGCVIPGPGEANISRVIALRLGCGWCMPAWTVQRNCASGMQALDSAFMSIRTGRSHLVLAGGTEAMSHAPLQLNYRMVNWLADLWSAKNIRRKLRTLTKFRPALLKPVIALQCGLTDPIVGLTMGETAEVLAHNFDISREEMDAYSAESHRRLAHARDRGFLDEIEVIYDRKGNFYNEDEGLHRGINAKILAKLRPVFDHGVGKVTAGNSSQITDGACLMLLASKDAVDRYNLPVLGRIIDSRWAALDPTEMGLGPVHAVPPLLQANDVTPVDIDYWEINEAFAGQVLSCLRAWESEEYCRNILGLDSEFGSIDRDRLNVDGGAISLGHPIGASGARIVLHLLHVMKRNNARRGVAALCVGGGQGGAMLLERTEGSHD
ncbi:MAG: acetyl-CoA C-acetyltransferase [Nitrospiraceae bacterium]|nr:MAG: acetyl-CoA C-acetyltransferase [Nitrospiraceae bacterium]